MIVRAAGKVVRKRRINGRAEAPHEYVGGDELRILKIQQGAIFHLSGCVYNDQGGSQKACKGKQKSKNVSAMSANQL